MLSLSNMIYDILNIKLTNNALKIISILTYYNIKILLAF